MSTALFCRTGHSTSSCVWIKKLYLTTKEHWWIRRLQICLLTWKWPNIIHYLPECYLIFAWYSLRGWIIRPRIITFLLRLLFDLGYRCLLFASTTNLEAGPRFAGIWCHHQASWACIYKFKRTLIILNSNPKTIRMLGPVCHLFVLHGVPEMKSKWKLLVCFTANFVLGLRVNKTGLRHVSRLPAPKMKDIK